MKYLRYIAGYPVKAGYPEKGDYCCETFAALLKSQKVKVFYSAEMRYYTLATVSYSGYQRLYYCFCCGKKFPKDLWAKWHSILKKEYKVKDPWEAAYEGKIPQEFMTDEWWKKRSL